MMKPALATFSVLCLVACQTYTTNATITKIAKGVAKSIEQLNPIQSMLDVGSSIEDYFLSVMNDGRIQNASSYTSFLLFTRDSGENGTQINLNDRGTLLRAGFDKSKNTKILIHGWIQNGTGRFAITLKNAFLQFEDLNIISVSWPKYSQTLYSVARDAVPYVGAYTASFIDFLVQDVGVDISTIHVLGFSLGAHIAGVVGESVTRGTLSRITGLDPAGPLYSSSMTKNRLDASDAKFVDVIHTTAGTFGFADPCGTVDFYPNGGFAPQPGCLLDPNLFCSHLRSFLLFSESISSEQFIATECNSYQSYEKGECSQNRTAVMGYHVDLRSKGVFYLKTNSKSPYAKQDK